MSEVRLVTPGHHWLPGYRAALEAGWSPNTSRDVSADHLAAIRADADAFLADQARTEGGLAAGPDGAPVPRLPGRIRWIVGERFLGLINLRFVPGTEALPPHVSGHVGYAVVPWERGRGVARRALAIMLPLAAEAGLRRVLVTCDVGNDASRRVIEANGGVPDGTEAHGAVPKWRFWVPTGV
ncbi:GNAT family N-acetyltransferase [Muricoccus radiodurans]|uniref:GNAT family N-acetyltransferase n=1 Tax=Muricoccus radiodurans TaxID=2231721 RepID=UPI003CF17F6B